MSKMDIPEILHFAPALEDSEKKALRIKFSENKKEFDVKLAREEYELIEMLNKIQSGAGLYAPTMNALWERIQAYGRMKFKEGVSVNDEEQ